ncbi:MAG: rhomboid family intramembrane serine protease [Bacteroidia bacterium]
MFQRLPTVTKNLLVINILLFGASVLLEKQGIDLTEKLGLHYFKAPMFKPYQFVTYLFMHGNFMHLFFNMFAVFMFGSVLESAWGPKRFLTYYIFTGLGAALTQFVVYYFQVTPHLDELQRLLLQTKSYAEQSQIIEYRNAMLNSPGLTVVGASGSLFGLLIAFGIMFPNTELMMMFIPIPIKAKYFVAIYGAIELFSGIANSASDNVAHFAHLGGMLFGFILLMIWRQRSHN